MIFLLDLYMDISENSKIAPSLNAQNCLHLQNEQYSAFIFNSNSALIRVAQSRDSGSYVFVY